MTEKNNNFSYEQNKKSSERKNCKVIFRCPDDINETLKSKSKKLGVTQSEFIRALIDDGKIIEQPNVDFVRLRREWRGIGNNINQIVKKFNSTGYIDEKKLSEELKKLNELTEKTMKEFFP